MITCLLWLPWQARTRALVTSACRHHLNPHPYRPNAGGPPTWPQHRGPLRLHLQAVDGTTRFFHPPPHPCLSSTTLQCHQHPPRNRPASLPSASPVARPSEELPFPARYACRLCHWARPLASSSAMQFALAWAPRTSPRRRTCRLAHARGSAGGPNRSQTATPCQTRHARCDR